MFLETPVETIKGEAFEKNNQTKSQSAKSDRAAKNA